jgi:putative endonuclease
VRSSGARRRQQAERRGRFGEWLCLWHLRLRGWRVVARGWRCPMGEIDIVARRGGVLAVIEVKSRVALLADGTAVPSPRQRRRIARAAQAFLKARPDLAGLDLRFDLMQVAQGRLPHHQHAAWRADD